MERLFNSMLMILAAMISVSCVENLAVDPQIPQEGDQVELIFTASFDVNTKTTLVNGTNVWWMPGDKIGIQGADSHFESLSEKPSATTQFKGTVDYASEYYAVYPYDALSSWESDMGKALVELPSTQNAVKGTFDNGLNIAVAKTGNKDLAFRFKNVLGYVKFTLTQNSGSIRSMSVTTEGLGGEALCGVMSIDCTSDTPSAVIKGSKGQTVSLVSTTSMQSGDYYVALVPGTYSRGLKFVFIDDQGRAAAKLISKEISLGNGQIRNIGAIEGLDFSEEHPSGPDSPIDGDFFVIDVPVAGTLNSIVTSNELGSHENIRITGNFNSDDVDYFTDYASSVVILDISALSFEDNTLDNGFDSLTSLAEVYMPVSLRTIEGNAFSECVSLEKVHWSTGSHLETIGMGMSRDLWDNVRMEGPFSYCTSLKSIDIPANVTEIKTSAFYGSGISSVNFAEDSIIDVFEATEYYVNNLGASQPVTGGMFMGCSHLETIDIPESVLMISDYAFKGWTGLKRLEIPESVKYISAKGLFYGCSRLEYVSVPSSLKVIPDHMFNGCSSLTDFDFAGGYTSIGYGAFSGCESLETIDLEGVKEFGNNAFSGVGFVRIRIPDGMTEIPSDLFFGCTKLKDIDFNQAEIIGDGAFGRCDAIESLVIADPIKEDNGGFAGCANLKEITVTSQNIKFSYSGYNCLPAIEKLVIGKNVLSATGNLELPADFNNFIFEEGGCLEEFGLCRNLNITSIDLPETVRKLSDEAFYGCMNLTNIDELLEGIEEIGSMAFWHSGVRSVNFPEGLKVIGRQAFTGCKELRMITLPSTTTSIGNGAFSACSKLMTSTVNGAELSVYGNIFQDCPFISSITIGKDVKTFECTALDKAITELIFEEGSQCTKITGNIFGSPCAITDVVLPPLLKEIGSSVFRSSGVSSIFLPESLEKIGEYAFNSYKANDDLVIPVNVSEFGKQAFYAASGTKLTLNCRRMNDMQGSPFYKSTYTTLELGPDVEYIGFALYADEIHCKGTFPPALGKYGELNVDVIYVPNDAYKEYYLSWQKYADLLVCEDGTVPEITDEDLGISESADNAFFYRTSDNKMVDLAAFDNGVAGANVTSHTYLNGYFTIVFDGKVTALPKSGFSDANLTELVLPEKLETIHPDALINNPDLKRLIIPKSVTTIYRSAFSRGVNNLTVVFDATTPPTFFDNRGSLSNKIGAKEFIVPYEGLLEYRRAELIFAPHIKTEDGSEPDLDENHVIYFQPYYTNYMFYEYISESFGKEISKERNDFGAEQLYCTYHNNMYVLVFGGDVTVLPEYFCGDYNGLNLIEAIIPPTVNCVYQGSLTDYKQTKRVLYFKSITPPLMPEKESGGYYTPKGELYLETIYVPSQSVDAYKSAAGWSLYADRIVGYDY